MNQDNVRGTIETKKVFVFELDDVLYPERDYDLQVYYLFAHFIEYLETIPPADDLIGFMKKAYDQHGRDGIFDRAAEAFALSSSYRNQFERLHQEAKLPLPLLMYPEVAIFLQKAHESGKQLVILTAGTPAIQLNKLRYLEWNGLEAYIKVYFQDELNSSGRNTRDFLVEQLGVEESAVLFFGKEDSMTADGIQHYKLANFT